MHVLSTVSLRARRVGAFLVALALALVLLGRPALAQTTVTSRVTAPLDDMEEWISSGNVDWNSSDLEMTSEGSGDQLIGLRFAGLNIPAGAYIVDARIQFTVDEVNNGATSLTFKGEAVDSAATFANAQFAVSARPTTAASVTWTVNAWNIVQEQGADQRTPNLRAVIQEVVARAGWKSGNALAVIITGSGKRVAESYEGATSGSAGHDATQAATLSVTYVIPTAFSVRVNASSDDAEESIATGAIDLTSSDLEFTQDGATQQYVGMRFTGVNVPKGAIITSAHIQFATDETQPDATNVNIRGQASDNAATFTAGTGNISSRPLTTASVSWAPPVWSVLQEAGVNQRTPDLSAVIQEIVNRSGWSLGNALVIRVDGTGHRTAESWDGSAPEAAQLVIRYYTSAPVQLPLGVFPVPKGVIWRYRDDGTDLGTLWRAPSYNDSTWAFGPAQLGYGDGDEATVVGFGPSSGSKYMTTYFRHAFGMSAAQIAAIDSLTISLMRDDGAVIYLNGVEVARSNMPAGAVGFGTGASSNVANADESRYFTFNIGKSRLVAGTNVLAVEVHQDVATSSDLSFSLGLDGFKADAKLLSSGGIWKYSDNAGPAPAGWNDAGFDDSGWKSGAAPLGYGNGTEATVLSYGGNAAFRNITSYFRKSFTVADTALFGNMVVRLKRDDGAVIYLNGVELLRSNMRSGPVTYLTPALTWVEGVDETSFVEYVVPRSALRVGTNVIAAEVHQNSPTSTDLAFDLELVLQGQATALTALGGNYSCDPAASTAIGCFTSVQPGPQQQTLVYPTATHIFQKLLKSNVDRFTVGGALVPGGNDFTGFVGRNGTSTRGTISVNHENTPGGVSVLDVHYDQATGLWGLDTVTRVDFSQVQTTERNCSGTVTPWGTTISCEESYNTGDGNGDGYHDVGWAVEIDPITRKIRDFDGDGKADKLWAVGRMSHENVCVARDSVTLYEGEDGGTGCVYKFVAARKARLDSGTLYVLKRDGATSTTGTWVQVPNTTKADRNQTSTLAGTLGGYRFGGVEDVEIGPDGHVYFTEKGRGDLWRFKDNGATVSELEPWVSNQMLSIATENGVVQESWGTGIDNLAFDNEGNLWALQDGGRNHLWMVRKEHTPANPRVELFATTPAGSEPTGLTFSPDGRFGFISFQHPNTTNTQSQKDATGADVIFDQPTTVVFARRENLGVGAIAPKVELGPDITACKGTVVTLKYFTRDGQNIWMDNSTDSVLRVSTSGTYRLSVIGNNGRIGTDSVRVTFIDPPTAALGPDRTICEGAEIAVTADPTLTYLWSDSVTSFRRTFNESGQYSVRVTNAAGCVVWDTINVFVTPRPQPRLGTDLMICRGGSLVLSAGDGFNSYLWSDGSTFPKLAVTQPGTYWVTVTNRNGCLGYDTVTVRQSPAPSLGDRIEICEGASATLTPGSIYAAYLWNDGSTAPVLSASKSGTYWVRVTDQGGCVSVDSVVVGVNPLPSIDLGVDTTVCVDCPVTLDAGPGFRSYKWSTGHTSRSIIVTKPGRYTVTVESQSGCRASDDITVRQQATSGVEETEIVAGGFSLRARPNPFTDEATIELQLRQRADLSVEIYDEAGRRVQTLFAGTAQAGSHAYAFDARKLDNRAGVYFVRVTVDGRTTTTKLVRR